MPDPMTEDEAFAAETAGFVQGKPTAEQSANPTAAAGVPELKVEAETPEEKVNGVDEKPEEEAEAPATKGKKDAAKADDEPKPEDEKDVPAFLKPRLERAQKQVTTEKQRADAEKARADQLEEDLAAERARNAKSAAAGALKKPDPADFEDPDDYEKARDDWAVAKRDAEKAAADPKPQPKPQEKVAAAPPLPLGLTGEDLGAAVDSITNTVPASVSSRIKDAAVVPVLPAAVLVEIGDETDKDRMTAMSRFVIGHPKTMKDIAKLPPRSQAAAFVRAFEADKPATEKRISGAPAPIDRNTATRGEAVSNLSKMSFREYDKAMDEQDRKEGRRPY